VTNSAKFGTWRYRLCFGAASLYEQLDKIAKQMTTAEAA
jgi:hypothetical protein